MSRTFAILPAAGNSVRMGRAKLLLSWQGKTVFEHVLANWRASRADAVVVVLQPAASELIAQAEKAGVYVVRRDPPPADMKQSVSYGLDFLTERFRPGANDYWLLAPADMPLLTADSIDRILAEPRDSWLDDAGPSGQSADEPTIILPTHAGRRGHPVRFPWALAGEVASLGETEGLNRLVARHRVREIEWPDASVLTDLDTPGDYRRLTGAG